MTDETTAVAVQEKVVGRDIGVSQIEGGLTFSNMAEVVDFARLMARSGVAVPRHLRENPGACLAVTIQAVEWRMSPFAVANKSYSVNDRLAYESQLIQAVVLQRAPIDGRIAFTFEGDGPTRRCTASCMLRNGSTATFTGVSYTTPMVKDIKVKNSPLWAQDPDQQLTYYAGRSLARRHFPDVLLGVYSEDELRDTSATESPARINPLHDDIEGQATVLSPPDVSPTGAADPSGETAPLPHSADSAVSPDSIVYRTPHDASRDRLARGHSRAMAEAEEIVTQDGTVIKSARKRR